MRTIDEKIKDCKRWKEAEKDLKEFSEATELMKPYIAERQLKFGYKSTQGHWTTDLYNL